MRQMRDVVPHKRRGDRAKLEVIPTDSGSRVWVWVLPILWRSLRSHDSIIPRAEWYSTIREMKNIEIRSHHGPIALYGRCSRRRTVLTLTLRSAARTSRRTRARMGARIRMRCFGEPSFAAQARATPISGANGQARSVGEPGVRFISNSITPRVRRGDHGIRNACGVSGNQRTGRLPHRLGRDAH
jgi:hypothetical protein